MKRRSFLTATGAVAAASLGLKAARDRDEAGLRGRGVHRPCRVVRRRPRARSSATAWPSWASAWPGSQGKSVLLKPNLVEPSRDAPQINTHPAVVRAAAEVFRRWQAREVFVAEGQGHCRDSELVLDASGLGPVLDAESRLEFVDLNHDDVDLVPNRLGFTQAGRSSSCPLTLRRADLIVSMPKMKTHHWAGVTLSMKNLFGVMPGVCYGWPKNVLHHAGIPDSILDINAAVRPHLAIVDGIIGMEGDGPIMGTPAARRRPRHGHEPPRRRRHRRPADGHRPRGGLLPRRRLGPARPDRRAPHHPARRADRPLVQDFQLLDHPSMAGLRG